jgi:hypothetical protein
MKFVYFLFSPHICPYCESRNIRRSRREGLVEFVIHWVFFLSPYRCRECYRRYFGLRFSPSSTQPVTTASK